MVKPTPEQSTGTSGEPETRAKPGGVAISYHAHCSCMSEGRGDYETGPHLVSEKFTSQGSANSWATQHIDANQKHTVELTIWCYIPDELDNP